jgi:hypothetical protein
VGGDKLGRCELLLSCGSCGPYFQHTFPFSAPQVFISNKPSFSVQLDMNSFFLCPPPFLHRKQPVSIVLHQHYISLIFFLVVIVK